MKEAISWEINISRIERLGASPGQRLIVVSDIHGQLDCLVRLLEKTGYGGEDILVVIGDLIEKGPDSLGVVRYLMELCNEKRSFHGEHYVYVSMGNMELARLQYFLDESPEAGEKFADYIRRAQRQWGGSLGQEMLAEMGVSPERITAGNAPEYIGQLRKKFRMELNFLKGLPTILTAGQYLFVHGGVPTDDLEALEGSDAASCLKNDGFWSKGYRFERFTVVTGHWPVCLYRRGVEDVSPLFDPERRIICIDGGCSIKSAGQLNALIIPDCMADMDEIGWTSCDGLPVIKALEAQEGTPASLNITYFDSQVELLETREGMAKFRHLSSGRVLELPESCLWVKHSDGTVHCGDFCDERLAVEAGDELSLVFETKDGYYVKKQGRIGWYCGAEFTVNCAMQTRAGLSGNQAGSAQKRVGREEIGGLI